MELKLELVIVPVTDVDRSKAFYQDNCGFKVDIDFRAGPDFRVVQMTPPGSACSISLMAKPDTAGNLQGVHLITPDIEDTRAELVGRGVQPTDVFHFEDGARVPGPDPERRDFGSFLSFDDPDGNGWVVQEVRRKRIAVEG